MCHVLGARRQEEITHHHLRPPLALWCLPSETGLTCELGPAVTAMFEGAAVGQGVCCPSCLSSPVLADLVPRPESMLAHWCGECWAGVSSSLTSTPNVRALGHLLCRAGMGPCKSTVASCSESRSGLPGPPMRPPATPPASPPACRGRLGQWCKQEQRGPRGFSISRHFPLGTRLRDAQNSL